MPKKTLTATSKFLGYLLAIGGIVEQGLLYPKDIRKMGITGQWKSPSAMTSAMYALIKNGYIKYENKNTKRFIKITKKGELEALFAKAILPIAQKWDGKWRLVIFDIPEETREKRDQLRFLLKKNNFKMLQASVFISPYALNREALIYLKQTGLIDYIRILKVEDMDNDKVLKKLFGLV